MQWGFWLSKVSLFALFPLRGLSRQRWLESVTQVYLTPEKIVNNH